MKKKIKRIGILTGGGDCPGLNAVIRAVVKKAIGIQKWEVLGINDGYDGLVKGLSTPLGYQNVANILTLGGTILGTSNWANPYEYSIKKGNKIIKKDYSKKAIANFKKWRLDALVAVGGDGTQTIAHQLLQDGVPIVGVPKTIDNDLTGTHRTVGFDTAVKTIMDAVDQIHSTAESHHRVMVVEVMGRYAGWLALSGGMAAGGDVVLIPEIPFTFSSICKCVKERHSRGKRCTIIVVSEGAFPKGGKITVDRIVKNSPEPIRLGGIGKLVADNVERKTGVESRVVVLGHLQRGGAPTAYDRVLATQFGTKAVDLLAEGKFGYMAALQNAMISEYPLNESVLKQRLVKPDNPLILSARSIGTCFGD
jgi:phosphofructokinase-like protein